VRDSSVPIARHAPAPARAVAALVVAGGLGAVGWAVISDARGGSPASAPPAAPAPAASRPLHQLPDLAAPAASWSSLPRDARVGLARQYLTASRGLSLTMTSVELAQQADAMARLRVDAGTGSSVQALLGLASRAVDPQDIAAARERYLPGRALVGRSAVAARDLVGAPDLSLGTRRRGTWYYDIGPSQHRLVIRGGRVTAAADVTSRAASGAFVGPPSARPTLVGAEPVAALPSVALASAAEDAGGSAAQYALTRMGTPYVWGGEAPGGFDCSGLVQWAYAQAGLAVPRVAADQATVGTGVARDDLRPGDVVFFADASGYVHHDGLYVGDGRFVHAPHTGDVVKVSSLAEPGYARQYAGARRYTPVASGAG
jgi:cell wall-associated NlpC family hydrolase